MGLASISALLYGNRACGVSGMPNVTPLGLPNHSRLKPTDVLHQSRGTVAKFSSILRAGRGSFVPMYPAKARGCRTAQFGTPSSTPGTWMFGSAAAWPIPVHASRHAVATATATVPCRSRPAAGWPCAGRSSSISSVILSSSLPSISDTPRCQIALSGQSVRSQETLISGIWPPGGSTAGCGLVRSATVTMADGDNAQFCRRRSAYTVATRDADR